MNNSQRETPKNSNEQSTSPTPTKHQSILQQIRQRQDNELREEECNFHAAMKKVEKEDNEKKQMDPSSLHFDVSALREPVVQEQDNNNNLVLQYPFDRIDGEDEPPTECEGGGLRSVSKQKSGLFSVLASTKKASSATRTKQGHSSSSVRHHAHLHYLTTPSAHPKQHKTAHHLQDDSHQTQDYASPTKVCTISEGHRADSTIIKKGIKDHSRRSSVLLSRHGSKTPASDDANNDDHKIKCEEFPPCPPTRTQSRIVDNVQHTSILTSLPFLNCCKKQKTATEEVEETEQNQQLRHGVAYTGLDTEGLPWRERLAGFIHTKEVQVILVVLLLLDVCLVIAELVLQSHNVCELSVKWERCVAPPAGAFPLIEEEIANASGFFAPTGCGVTGKAVMPHEIHTAEVVLVWCSRVILFVFFVEIAVLMVCLGRRFFTVLYTLDFIIVTTSLVLSFIFDGNAKIESETALIIFLRCWRFARVLHGFGITVHNVSTDEISGSHEGHSPLSGVEDEITETEKCILTDLKEAGETLPTSEGRTGGGAGTAPTTKEYITSTTTNPNRHIMIEESNAFNHQHVDGVTDEGNNEEEDTTDNTTGGATQQQLDATGRTLAKRSLYRLKGLRNQHRQELIEYCRWLEDEVAKLTKENEEKAAAQSTHPVTSLTVTQVGASPDEVVIAEDDY